MHAEIERAARTAVLVTDRPWPPGAIAHPFLAAPAIAFAWWERREAMHGGAFVTGGCAWAVLAEKGGGKSTTLAALAAAGATVVADDLLIIVEGRVLAGPRCIDLTPEAAAAVGASDARRDSRTTKLRMSLGPTEPERALGGLVHLSWGDRAEVRAVPVQERAARIARHRSVFGRHSTAPGGILDLLRLPSYELRRPKRMDSLSAAVDLLLGLGG